MASAIFPSGFTSRLEKALRKFISKIVQKIRRRIGVSKESVIEAASRFIAEYRLRLIGSPAIANIIIPGGQGPKEGFGSPTEALTTPMLGMLGLPPVVAGAALALLNGLTLESNFFNLKITKINKRIRGQLTFDFETFASDSRAAYFVGDSRTTWMRLLEYGISAPGYWYGYWIESAASRSMDGIMISSKGGLGGFVFPPTYTFRNIFELVKSALPVRDRELLSIRFVG